MITTNCSVEIYRKFKLELKSKYDNRVCSINKVVEIKNFKNILTAIP